MRLLETLRRLQALSHNESAPEGERNAAKAAIERILAANPNLSLDDISEQVPDQELVIRYKRWEEQMLLKQIGWFLGLEVYSMRSVAANRPVKRVKLKGDPRLIAAVKPLHKQYKKQFQKLVEAFALGWAYRTLPPAPTDEEGEGTPLSEEEMQALRLGAQIGTRHESPHPKLNETNAKASLEEGQ